MAHTIGYTRPVAQGKAVATIPIVGGLTWTREMTDCLDAQPDHEARNSKFFGSVSNLALVGKGAEKNVAAWTHLKGVEWAAWDEKTEIWTVNQHDTESPSQTLSSTLFL